LKEAVEIVGEHQYYAPDPQVWQLATRYEQSDIVLGQTGHVNYV